VLKRIPIAANPLPLNKGFLSISHLCREGETQEKLKKSLYSFVNKKHSFFFNSGLAGFFIILKALGEIFPKREVILPAYTAPSLIVAVKKAGLKPVLCDISLDDFNMDINLLSNSVSKNTLCILGVHMFGIVSKEIENLKKRFPDVFIIEDCAQSMGSKIRGMPVGGLGDVSFFSFNRGKNIPTYGGGCITTDSDQIADNINKVADFIKIGDCGISERLAIFSKVITLSIVIKPWIYGLLYPLISRFKEIAPPKDFEIREYTDYQAAVALYLLKRIEEFSKKRYDNGMRLIGGLKDTDSLMLPQICQDTEPAFNRFPVVFKNLEEREEAKRNLWKAGIETSRMYFSPLHYHFSLGYRKEDFPNATYFAQHLLTLPSHPLLTAPDIDKIIEIIQKS